MTKITIFTLLGWSVAGCLIGAGLTSLGLPPAGVALTLAGLGVFALTCRAVGVAITCFAGIILTTPAIMPSLPLWAAISIACVIYLFICDLTARLN